MPEITLDPKALEAYLPHRGCNVMPDRVVLNDARNKAISYTRVPKGDVRGREIFGRTEIGGQHCWYEPFLGELMALTGVPLLHDKLSPSNQVAVFSMISRISFHRVAPLDKEIIGHAEITRDRGNFFVFSTHAEVEGERILEAEVMAGASTLAEISAGKIRPLINDKGGHAFEPGLLAWKNPATRFVNHIVESDATTLRLVADYHYPHDHPFVPGHFPGGALMMGVTQWAMVADAGWLARNQFGLSGNVLVNGTVKRQDGSEVLDVRDLQLSVFDGLPRITATKRLAFREPVRPGDGLLIDITVKSV
jgi:3-hydroxymyristoyl/3-hydroxydecanoyl-(acyl carrier protein) dehydratase